MTRKVEPVPTRRSRRASASLGITPADEELRLPRPPGVIRQFWVRHPLFSDILIALICLFLSLAPAGTSGGTSTSGGVEVTSTQLVWAPFPVLAVAGCVLLVWRRRWPVAVFAVSGAVAVSYLFAPIPVGGPLLLVTTYTLAVYGSSRACWIGLGTVVGCLVAIGVPLAAVGVLSWSVALNAIVGEGVLGLIGALIGVNVGNRKRYLDAVIARSRQLLVERDQQSQLAAAAERARIAREMHDIVSHSLTVIVALSEGAMATADRDRARDAMDAAATTAREALTEMRAMLGVLRDGDPDVPLAPTEAVDPGAVVTTAQRAGYPATLTVRGEPAGSDVVRLAVGRIVQEGVTNAMRHAPSATAITVRIDYSNPVITIDIRNDGARRPSGGGGFGIRGLMERAAHAGGTLTSAPAGPGEWMLHAELPAQAAPPALAAPVMAEPAEAAAGAEATAAGKERP